MTPWTMHSDIQISIITAKGDPEDTDCASRNDGTGKYSHGKTKTCRNLGMSCEADCGGSLNLENIIEVKLDAQHTVACRHRTSHLALHIRDSKALIDPCNHHDCESI